MASSEADLLQKLITYSVPPLLLLTPIAIVRSVKSLLNGSRRPIQAVGVPLLLAALLGTLFRFLPPLSEDVLNHAHLPVKDVYKRLAEENTDYFEVSDLHCDTLMWSHRDIRRTTTHPLLKNRTLGAVDLPRLATGNVRIQVFATVNSLPRKMNFKRNNPPSLFGDIMVIISVLQGWPFRTWFSAKQRVLYQAHNLHKISANSNGALRVARSSDDILTSESWVLGVLAVEGLSGLEGDVRTVDEFYEAGIRILGPVHFFDTDVGGSSAGTCNCGLSEFGRTVMKRMKTLEMIVDLAHASNMLVSDILDLEEDNRPSVILSHTGLQSICPSPRNIDDKNLKRISENGGLVGIALFEPALCGGDIIGSFVKTVSYAAQVLGGVDSIALGSDWDGAIKTSVSAADTHLLSSALLKIGNFSQEEVRKILFENSKSFLESALPHSKDQNVSG